MSYDPIIYVVDDDDDSRESASALIGQMALRVQEFSTGEDFLAAYDGHRPGCLLTDHRMLGMTGVELLESLRKERVSLSVIVMTAYADTELTVRAIRSGAVTLLEKPFSNTALWNAIHQALSEDQIQHADDEKTNGILKRLDTLTAKELDVLKLIVKGNTNKAVALQLDVSVRTVEGRRSCIFEKMDIASVAELVQQVMIARPDYC